MLEDSNEEYKSIDELKKEFDKYDKWLLEGNPSLKKNDLQHGVFYETGYFVVDDQSMKIYDANEYYRAVYEGTLDDLKEVAVIDVKNKEFFEKMKILYD